MASRCARQRDTRALPGSRHVRPAQRMDESPAPSHSPFGLTSEAEKLVFSKGYTFECIISIILGRAVHIY